MKIYKNGSIVFSSIDNTGSTDEASLGARYAMGRLDSTWNNLTQNYYTKDQVTTLIEQALNDANLLKAMVVPAVPATSAASPNIIYLVPVTGSDNVYQQYKKVLVSQDPDEYTMALLGSTEVELQDIQVAALPTPTVAQANKVLQYVGEASSRTRGRFYWCAPKNYYAWDLSTDATQTFYVENNPPRPGDNIFTGRTVSGEFIVTVVSQVATVPDSTHMTDTNGMSMLRNTVKDVVGYSWIPLLDRLSEYVNDGDGTSPFVTKDYVDALISEDLTTIVTSLPSTGVANTRYLLKVTDASTVGYHFDEYIYTDGKWVYISKEQPAPFIATINETSQAQIKAAIDAGNPIYVYSDITGVLRPAITASATTFTASIQYLSLSGTSGNYTVDITSCSITGTNWTPTQIAIATKVDLEKYVHKLAAPITSSTTNYIRAFAMSQEGLVTSTSGAYTKSDTISSSSTDNQLPSAKAVWTLADTKLNKVTTSGVNEVYVHHGASQTVRGISTAINSTNAANIPTVGAVYNNRRLNSIAGDAGSSAISLDDLLTKLGLNPLGAGFAVAYCRQFNSCTNRPWNADAVYFETIWRDSSTGIVRITDWNGTKSAIIAKTNGTWGTWRNFTLA